MSQQGLWRPLLVITLGLALIVTVLANTERATSVTLSQGYPEQTQTALAYLSPTQSTPTQVTPTITPTATLTSTTIPATPTPTFSPTVAVQPAQATPIPPPPTPTPAGTLACVPGTTILIEGTGPPRAPILIFFGTRVVGGGSVRPDGTFSLPLIIGEERAGQYEVRVRIRGTDTVLREVTCGVPPVTPTPFPTGRPGP